jgi:signal transduction histidine kinase
VDTKSLLTIIVLGLASGAIVLLGTIVLMRNKRRRLHQAFFALSLSGASWVLTNLVFGVTDNHDVQFIMALLSYGSAGAMVLFFLLYCTETVQVRLKHQTYIVTCIAASVMTIASMLPGFIALNVTTEDKIVTNLIPLDLYSLYVLIYLVSGLRFLVRGRARSRGVERSKITIVLLGLILATIVGVTFNLIFPLFDNYTFFSVGPVATLFLVGSSTYAIVRHRMFDIKLAAVRTFAYVASLLTVSGVYFLVAYLLPIVLLSGGSRGIVSVSPVNILLALGIAFLFQPVKRFFDRRTNDLFYREEYRSEEFFANLSTLLSSTIDLRGLLQRASEQIASTFKADQAFFLAYYTDDSNHHVSAGTHGHAKVPMYDARMLDEYVRQSGSSLVLTDMIEDAPSVTRMLKSHKIALVMPLRHDETIAGYVILGEHLSRNYSKRDQNVLMAVGNELVIAIQNALSLHEVKELNATLQQRIDVATKELRSSNAQLKHLDEIKDEFISMASHQLRTPLTSIKGYLSMVLEGDAGKVTQQQHKLLIEAFNSSERMVGLIGDFLNVSRLQTGRFLIEKTPFDLKQVIEQEVNSLQMIATTHDMKLKLNVPSRPLPVLADEQKIRQVIMNFIDNAIYYSPPKSTILVNVEHVRNEASLTVVDTGIGVPEEAQARLFTKFFRAANARKQRPDGTGVGLYLARRVVNGHNGTIIFSSKEGKGSTFGFRIPLAKAAAAHAVAAKPAAREPAAISK